MIQGVAAKWSFSSLSADKGVNQIVTMFTPFITPQKESIPAKSCKTSWGLYSYFHKLDSLLN